MKKLLSMLVFCAAIAPTFAGTTRGLTVYQIRVDYANPSWSYFRTNPLGANGTEYGPAYVFDASTSQGKGILALLMQAKATGITVGVDCGSCGATFGGWGTPIVSVSLD